jgi:hypothetical protein
MDFLTKDSLIVSDDKGRLTLFTNVLSEETISMQIIETDNVRIRMVNSFNFNDLSEESNETKKPIGGIFTTVSKKGV